MSGVLADRGALGVGAAAFVLAAALFAASGQMLAWGTGRPVLLATSGKALIFGALAVLVGVQAALHRHAVRLRTSRGGTTAGLTGFALAFLGASCCTPLVWPAVLSLAGVSGVALVGFNAWLHQWFWVPVGTSAAALGVGLWQAARAIATPCEIPGPRPASVRERPHGARRRAR